MMKHGLPRGGDFRVVTVIQQTAFEGGVLLLLVRCEHVIELGTAFRSAREDRCRTIRRRWLTARPVRQPAGHAERGSRHRERS